MSWLIDILTNPFLLTSMSGWGIAQVLKVIINAVVYKKYDWKRLFGDGGMPSAHTATVSSVAALACVTYGFASFEFAICALLTLIVCRDAVGVRMETGKQAQIINELRSILENPTTADIKLKEFVGHTPLQVAMGAVLGIIVAIVIGAVI